MLFRIKDIIDEDFTNYKKPAMFIATSFCTFKCEKEDCNVKCQNQPIVKQPIVQLEMNDIINRYLNNDITNSIVIGGLEPFDQFDELLNFIKLFREKSQDDLVIYTGYTEDEIKQIKYDDKNIYDFVNEHSECKNIIIKYGRFKSDSDNIFDSVLGITLASNNQYAKKIC